MAEFMKQQYPQKRKRKRQTAGDYHKWILPEQFGITDKIYPGMIRASNQGENEGQAEQDYIQPGDLSKPFLTRFHPPPNRCQVEAVCSALASTMNRPSGKLKKA